MIKDLPQKLKALRVQYGFSQKQVAEKINVSPSIVSGYETGERTPSTENLLSLAYLYNVSTDYLLFGEECKAIGDSALANLINGLSQADLEKAKNVMMAVFT